MANKYDAILGEYREEDSGQWQADSPGIIYPGHIAVGADADVNGTGQFNSFLQDLFGVGTVQAPVLIQETATGTPSFYNIGLGIKYGANFTGNVGGLIGNENTTTVVSGNSSDVTIAVGHYNTFIHRGTGTIGTIYGQADGVHNQSTGTITTAYAMFAQGATNTGGGSIGTVHGLLVEPQTVGSNNYGVTIGGASTNTLWLDNTADSTTASKGIVFGVSKDTNLYRSAAGRLKTDSRFDVAGAQITLVGSTTALRQTASNNANNDVLTSIVSGDSNYRLQVLTSGKMNWGDGSSAVDTNLYRSAANTLKTDDSFVVGGSYIYMPSGSAAAPGLAFGSDTDTGIYRYAANNLAFSTAGTLRWRVASNGTLYPGATATYNIGDYFTRVNAAYIGTIYNNGGTAAAPGSSIPNATNAGMYYSSSTLGLSVGGTSFISGHASNGVNVAPSGGKLGFFTVTPVTRQTELTDELTTITHTAPGTPDYAIQNLTNTGGYGFVTQDEGNTVLSVIANLQTRVNELETKLVAYGLLVDSD